MRYVSFAFVAEGSSDLHLKAFIENLLIYHGVDEVVGYEVSGAQCEFIGGRSVEAKINFLNRNYSYVNFYIVHRDADGAGYKARSDEIYSAAERNGVKEKVVPLITEKMLEAWLLTDKNSLKIVAGKPNYNGNYNGIDFSSLDTIADPKDTLENLLCSISGCTGNKLKTFRKNFPEMRMRLANQLSIDNEYLRGMNSFQEFKANLIAKVGMF